MPAAENLLFIWTDQQSANTLPCYGNSVVDAPNLTALAEQGLQFDRPYVTQPLCGPSRSSIMTGRYPHTTGLNANNIPLPIAEACLPELSGFDDHVTGWIGKWHLGDDVFRQHGFDEWVSTEDAYRPYYTDGRDADEPSSYHEYLLDQGFEPDRERPDGFEWFSRSFTAQLPEVHTKAAFMARAANEFLEAHQDEPFVLYLMFLEPHFPYHSPRDDQYRPADVPLPENFDHDGFEDQPAKVRYGRALLEEQDAGPAREFLGTPPTPDDWRELISNYWGLVSLVDSQVGTVLSRLEELALREKTVTVYTSDHGDMMGSHRLVNKGVMFEEAVKVPLLLRIPELTAESERIETPVSQIDLLPTILEAMGRPVPARLQGRSWLADARKQIEVPEENVYIEWNGHTYSGVRTISTSYIFDEGAVHPPQVTDAAQAVWDGIDDERSLLNAVSDPVRTVLTPDGWKLNYRRSGEHELYHLDHDPYETENLAGPEHEELIDELYREIYAWQLETHDPVAL